MRFSGFLGGAHPKHDSGFAVLRQIIANDPSQSTLFIIAGDKKPGKAAVIGYNRLLLNAPSTLKGQYLKTCIHLIYNSKTVGQQIIALSHQPPVTAVLQNVLQSGSALPLNQLSHVTLASAFSIITFLESPKVIKDLHPLNQYPSGMEQDHDAQKLMYVLIQLAFQRRKLHMTQAELTAQRGLTASENAQLAYIMGQD